MLKINEIFYSVQGEGPEIGKPVVFIRVQGCNMIPKCKFCDSSYSWDGTEGKEMSNEEIFEEVMKYNCENIIFTGGEPTCQLEGIKELEEFFWKKKEVYIRMSIESNGLIDDDFLYEFTTKIISPKKQCYNLDILKKLNFKPNTYFKFVFDKDLWFMNIINELELEPSKIFIMPEGKTKPEQEEKMEEVIEFCKEKGYMFSPRLHILVWSDRRKK